MSVDAGEVCGEALRELTAARARADAALFRFVQRAAFEIGDHLLSESGVVSLDELSRTAQERLRATTKRLLVEELILVAGMGRQESHDLVALALTPLQISFTVTDALERGEVSWGLLRRFHDSVRHDKVEVVAAVTEALFGTDTTVAAVERLDLDGSSLHGRPWTKVGLEAAKARELAAHRDPDDEAEKARGIHRRRGAHVSANPDGSADVHVNGPLTTWAPAAQRVDAIARSLRAGGDARTLDQLRHDVIAALCLHGVLPFPGAAASDGESSVGARQPSDDLHAHGPGGVESGEASLSVEDLEQIATVVNARPSTQLQVIVPVTTLMGKDEVGPVPPQQTATDPAVTRRAVGEIVGRVPTFLTGPFLRQLALAPGSTLTRIVVDPLDGRCVERSLRTYRPDTDMRRQIRAADVYSRAPGSRAPATACDLDHVTPWASPETQDGEAGQPPPWSDGPPPPGAGVTKETNLQALHRGTHLLKTMGHWRAAMSATRDITWTTLLGQHVTTRPHNYRQYLPHLSDHERTLVSHADELAERLRSELEASGSVTRWAATQPSTDDAIARASQVLYAVLATRGPGELLGRPDDDPRSLDSHFLDSPSLHRVRRAARAAEHRRLEHERRHPAPEPGSRWAPPPPRPHPTEIDPDAQPTY